MVEISLLVMFVSIFILTYALAAMSAERRDLQDEAEGLADAAE
jgi:hypothetical protein